MNDERQKQNSSDKGGRPSWSDCSHYTFEQNYDRYHRLTREGSAAAYCRDVPSVMVRGLDGGILFWNPGSELNYGWSKNQAVGSVSHTLLQTRFPYSIDQINAELVRDGVWEGDLIHTMSDGSQVKVRSRWELQPDDRKQSFTVFEINRDFKRLSGAGVSASDHARMQMKHTWNMMLTKKWWWLVPALFFYALVFLLVFLTEQLPIAPIP